MGSLKILNKEYVPMAELKEELAKVQKRDGELNYRGNRTQEYLDACVQQKGKDAKALVKALTDLDIPRLREEHIVKIVDVLPRSVEELKVVLSSYTLTVSQDNLKKIVAAVNDAL